MGHCGSLSTTDNLNKMTRVDPYLLSYMEEKLALLALLFCRNLATICRQIEMELGDKENTSVNTQSGQYQWRRMPMGLVNNSAIFQRTLDASLARILAKTCYVYLDDIIIFCQSLDQYLKDIETVLRRQQATGLKLLPSKCQFPIRDLKYLRHFLSEEEFRLDPETTHCVNEFPGTTIVKEKCEFLGLIVYCRRHIPDFFENAKSLTALTSKKGTFSWSM